jgi:hypothetical protein
MDYDLNQHRNLSKNVSALSDTLLRHAEQRQRQLSSMSLLPDNLISSSALKTHGTSSILVHTFIQLNKHMQFIFVCD